MTAEVLETIEMLRRQGKDFVLATHEMGFARRVADQIALVIDGRIAEIGPPQRIFDDQTSPAARHFLEKALRW
jgi:ABC-type histidine transport system ATPase subunit